MEVLNDLLSYKNMKIYQETEGFSFCLDSILLSEFVVPLRSTKKILDIGTGTGVIPLVLSQKTKAHIDAIEIQKELADLCVKSITYNQLEKQITLIHGDVKEYAKQINNDYDIIISNPPYFKEKKQNSSSLKKIARHEVCLNLDELISVSKRMLKNGGYFYLVYDTNRFMEVLDKLNANRLIPKIIRFIHQDKEKDASMFLVKCIKNGNPGLKIIRPFILYDSKIDKSIEYQKVFNKKEENDESEKL